jgi:pyrophosphatase PpaX
MQLAQHWIFDLDGTLVDSVESYFDTLRHIFGLYKIPHTDADIERGLTMHSSLFLPQYFNEAQCMEASRAIQARSEEGSTKIHAYPGIENVLKHLKNRGARLAVWTGRDSKSAKMILKNTQLTDYFDLCIGGSDVTEHKPHPQGIFKIMEHWKRENEPVVMVGDHEVDMRGALDSGIFGVRVTWSAQNHKPCDLSHKEFPSVSGFHSWIQELR